MKKTRRAPAVPYGLNLGDRILIAAAGLSAVFLAILLLTASGGAWIAGVGVVVGLSTTVAFRKGLKAHASAGAWSIICFGVAVAIGWWLGVREPTSLPLLARYVFVLAFVAMLFVIPPAVMALVGAFKQAKPGSLWAVQDSSFRFRDDASRSADVERHNKI